MAKAALSGGASNIPQATPKNLLNLTMDENPIQPAGASPVEGPFDKIGAATSPKSATKAALSHMNASSPKSAAASSG